MIERWAIKTVNKKGTNYYVSYFTKKQTIEMLFEEGVPKNATVVRVRIEEVIEEKRWTG